MISNKNVGSKNKKEFTADLKRVYKASTKELAESELDSLEKKWGDKYPEDIRRIIYTTNTIEAVHRQFRKLTKTKGAFPNKESLLKLLYLGI